MNVLYFAMFVGMNVEISAVIVPRESKFGIVVALYYV